MTDITLMPGNYEGYTRWVSSNTWNERHIKITKVEESRAWINGKVHYIKEQDDLWQLTPPGGNPRIRLMIWKDTARLASNLRYFK